MTKKIYIGTSDFAKIITGNGLFADKSLFIKEIIDSPDETILITRPRRFGKTLSQSMLQYFFEPVVAGIKTAGLFDNLAIAKVDSGRYIREYQGKSPVIFISFKDVKESTFAGCLNNLNILIQALYREHEYLLTSTNLSPADLEIYKQYLYSTKDPQHLAYGLKFLSELIYKHYSKKVYILIDEYDTPLNEAYLRGYIDELTNFMRNLISATLKDNRCLEKGIMTGILRISKDSMLSGLNNLKVYTILDKKFNQYFGFTDNELDLLFKAQGQERNEPEVKRWYDGYNFAGIHIYNPWSILYCLTENGALEAYWVNTGSTLMIEHVLENFQEKVAHKVTMLMEKKEIIEPIDKYVSFDIMLNDESSLWGLLLFSGHLTASVEDITEDNLYNCSLRIPNKELMTIFNRHYHKWFKSGLGDNYTPFLTSLITGDFNLFEVYLNQYLISTISVRDGAKTPENFYHGLMLGLIASLRATHVINSNRESGHGFYDVSIMPLAQSKHTIGLILEFKIANNNEDLYELAQTAITQINIQQYDTELKMYPHVSTIMKVGLAFNKKQVRIVYATV